MVNGSMGTARNRISGLNDEHGVRQTQQARLDSENFVGPFNLGKFFLGYVHLSPIIYIYIFILRLLLYM